VRRYIEQEVAKWTFKRNPREGEAGNAISYIDLGACAVPTPTGGISMGLAMHWQRAAHCGRRQVVDRAGAAERGGSL
jgi:hypothetical protein